MDDLNDILVFARVADLGSFTAAARRLELPKSTVSARVARLEERLGMRLIERTTRKLRLTDVGARYHEHARRAILTLEEAAATVASSRSRPVGALRVSTSVVMGQTLLSGVVAEFVGRHPDVQVFIDLTNRRVDLIEEGFDLALRAGSLPDSALVARRIGHAGARLYAAPGYLRRLGSPMRPADLAEHQLLEGNPTPSATSWTLRHDVDGRQERIDARFRLITNDVTTLQTAALAGLGIASLPTFAAHDDCATGRLRPVLADWSTRQLDIHAVYPSHKSLSPAVRAFVELASKRIRARLASEPLSVKARPPSRRRQ